ncbi:MAG: radical SAM protein [bacterium]
MPNPSPQTIDFYSFNVDTPVGYSLGVALLSEELKQRGHRVRLCLVDERVGLPWDVERLVAHSAEADPDVVALSFASSHEPHARTLIGALAERLPACRIVVGGVHPTIASEDVIRWPGVHALGRGECDGLLADFIDAWAAGDDAPAVPGFWVRRPNETILKNPQGPLPTLEGVAPLNADLDLRRIVRANRGIGNVAVTRGCPKRCSYCHNHTIRELYAKDLGRSVALKSFCRRRSVDDAITELLRLRRVTAGELRAINFDDDTLLTDRAWFFELARRIRDEVDLPYVMMGDVERIDEPLARLLAETNCLLIKFGIESGSPRLRKERLHRGASIDGVVPAFELLHAHGVNARSYVLVGVPTEIAEDVHKTFALCGHSQTDSVRLAYLQPYVATEIYDYCEAHGLFDPDAKHTSYFTGSPLRWPPAHSLLLEKMLHIHPWMTSAYLPENAAADQYRALTDEVLAMDRAQWEAPKTLRWLRQTTLELDRDHRRATIPHYLAPFPDRLDASFLVRRRRLPFPNVDDCWPPDAPWKDDPLP